MEIVQMKGPRAYANYCEAFNDCAPNSLPRFDSAKNFWSTRNALNKKSGICAMKE